VRDVEQFIVSEENNQKGHDNKLILFCYTAVKECPFSRTFSNSLLRYDYFTAHLKALTTPKKMFVTNAFAVLIPCYNTNSFALKLLTESARMFIFKFVSLFGDLSIKQCARVKSFTHRFTYNYSASISYPHSSYHDVCQNAR
jgi:hypothetical protein